jgi:hypothetical protein
VEQRHAQHERRLWGVGVEGLGPVWLPDGTHRRSGSEAHQRAEHGAMCRDSALRMTGRARGVEDRDVVVGVDLDLRHGDSVPQQVIESRGTGGRVRRRSNHDHLSTDGTGSGLIDADQTLLVGEHYLGARIVECVDDLVGHPPGVERHSDRADRGDGDEGGDPLGIVAHRDRHPVALGDTEIVHQGVTDLSSHGQHLRHRPTLVLVDDEVVVTNCRQLEQGSDVRRGTGEHLGRDPADVCSGDLEHRPGRAHGLAGLAKSHRHSLGFVAVPAGRSHTRL